MHDPNTFDSLPKEGVYKVKIDSSLEAGSLTYAEAFLPEETEEEILFSTYLCHPSMAVNELPEPLVTAFLYEQIKNIPNRKYSYRFLFAPETVGVIAFLSKQGEHLKKTAMWWICCNLCWS